jgi:hypothetical protein
LFKTGNGVLKNTPFFFCIYGRSMRGLMMPAATPRSMMRLVPAKALSRHDRVNHIDDACGIGWCKTYKI